MDYKQFEKYMLSIKESIDVQLGSMNIVDIDFLEKVSGNITEGFIELIEQQLDDPFNTISWFVFDREFGKQDPTIVDENDIVYKIDSIEALWNFLTR